MATEDRVVEELNRVLADRYEFHRELGAGGMATVYLATDLKHRRHVAVKVLRPELTAALGPERFLKEIEVTAKLNHPHILSLYDSGEAAGFLYYVMPHVEGESLRERLDRERELPVEDSVRIASALATALDYAHRQSVVHRDIKPRNILLQDGQPLIADFGIALAVSAAAGDRLTATGLSIGTPQYMSPEQASADRPVDGRTDVYALACILFEMLAGEPPFTGRNPGALLARKLTDTAPDVSAVRDTVPPAVGGALRRALSRTPADRFASAADFARALAEPPDVTPPAGVPRPGGARSAHATRVLYRWRLALASLVVGAAAGVGIMVLGAEDDRTPPVALTIPLDGAELVGANWRILAISPDGSHYAYLAEDSTARRLYVKPAAGAARVIEGSEWAMYPTFSPDGRSLAYFAQDAIWRLDVDDGSAVRIGASSGAVLGSTWTDDERLVFTQGYRGGLSTVPAGGGAVVELSALDSLNTELSHRQAHALPRTTRVLFRANGRQSGVWTLDTRTGERAWLTEGSDPQYADGFLFFVRDVTLYGQRFDVDAGTLTGEAVSLLDGVGNDYAVSESGTLLYLTSRGTPDSRLVLVDADGGRTVLWPEPARFLAPSISPDGTLVAVAAPGATGANELRVYDLEAGTEQVIAARGGPAVWSRDPDSSALLYPSGQSIMRYHMVTHGPPLPLISPEEGVTAATPSAWSRDGDILYYLVDLETLGDLWVRWPGGEVEPVFNGPEITLTADISPVLNRLAFTRGPAGEDMRVHVTSTPFPDGRASRVVSGIGAFGPRWAPDGGSVFFVERSELVRVSIDADGIPGERRTILRFDRQPNFLFPPFDVHPDGERLVVALPLRSPPPEIMVITGWLDSVRDRIR